MPFKVFFMLIPENAHQVFSRNARFNLPSLSRFSVLKISGRGGESLIKSEKTSTYPMFEKNVERFVGLWFSVTRPHYQISSLCLLKGSFLVHPVPLKTVKIFLTVQIIILFCAFSYV
jgi:hypothetical protein